MTENGNPVGFSADEQAAWAAMSGQEAPAPDQVEDDPEPAEEFEAADDADGADEPAPAETAKPKTVPHGALHQERERRKQIEAEYAKTREQLAVLNDRWQTIQRLQQQAAEQQVPAQDDDPEPDPNQDIFAHQQWLSRRYHEQRAFLEQQQAAAYQAQQQQQEEAAVWSAWEQDVSSYSQQQQDFGDAAKFLSGMRDRALKAAAVLNPQFNDAGARAAVIDQELAAIVRQARGTGQNAAAVIYNIAREYGYQAAAAAPQPGAAPAMPEKLANVQKAQAASKSLSQAGGQAGGAPMTAEALAAMAPDDFNAWYAKPANAKLFKKMMGG